MAVVGDEREEDWQEFLRLIIDALSPATFVEFDLAEDYAKCRWRLRRVHRLETQTLSAQALAASTREATWPAPAAELAALRDEAADMQQAIKLLEYVQQSPARTKLNANEAETFLDVVCEGKRESFGTDTVPAEAWKHHDFEGWTVGRARKAAMTIGFYVKNDDPIAAALTRLTDEHASLQAPIAAAEARAAQLELARRSMPDERILHTLPRYEAHLARRALSVLHEIEALQRARAGRPTPLARLEINGPLPAGENYETNSPGFTLSADEDYETNHLDLLTGVYVIYQTNSQAPKSPNYPRGRG
jgi:hypothetical protein